MVAKRVTNGYRGLKTAHPLLIIVSAMLLLFIIYIIYNYILNQYVPLTNNDAINTRNVATASLLKKIPREFRGIGSDVPQRLEQAGH